MPGSCPFGARIQAWPHDRAQAGAAGAASGRRAKAWYAADKMRRRRRAAAWAALAGAFIGSAIGLAAPAASRGAVGAVAAPGPEPEVAWAVPTSGTQPVRAGRLVLVIAPDQRAVLALDEGTGKKVWQAAAPHGVTFSSVIAQAPSASASPTAQPLLLVMGYDAQGEVIARLGPGGALRWQRGQAALEGFADPDLAEHGDVVKLFSRARCAARFLDAGTGTLLGPAGRRLSLGGQLIERWPIRGMDGVGGEPRRSCEDTLSLLAAIDGTVLVSDFGKRSGLSALSPAQPDSPRWKLDGLGFRLVSLDWPERQDRQARQGGEGAAVLFAFLRDDRALLTRVRVRDGKVLWQRPLDATCPPGASEVAARLPRAPRILRSASGQPTAVLVQDCRQATLIELPAGTPRWSRPTEGALALLRTDTPTPSPGTQTETEADGEDVSLPGQPGALVVRWFTPAGQPAGQATLDPTTRAVTPIPGGLVAHNQDLDRVWLVRADGGAGWQHAERFGNSFRRGDRYVVLPSGSPTAQVTIDLATGRTWRLVLDSPFVLGRALSDPSLWLTTRRAEVVALRLR